jgi:methyl-accepting chemotaxis protein
MKNDVRIKDRAIGPERGAWLTIPRRLALLILVAMMVSVSAFAVQLRSLRDTLFEERENAVRNEVQSAASLVRAIAEEAKLGHITDAEAQERAKRRFA